jgi:hypothetical protein
MKPDIEFRVLLADVNKAKTLFTIVVVEVDAGTPPLTTIKNHPRGLRRIEKQYNRVTKTDYAFVLAAAQRVCRELNAARGKPRTETQFEAERRWIGEHPLGEKA